VAPSTAAKIISGWSSNMIGDLYAKDINKVYYKAITITNADPKTFSVLGDLYAIDKMHVFYEAHIITGNPNKFKLIGKYYGKDDEIVYSGGVLLSKVKDAKSFELIKDNWAKDKFYYYASGKPILGADYNSFEIIDEGYAKDKSSVYFETLYSFKVVKNADPKTFKLTGKYNNIGRDKNGCYFFGEQTDCK